MSWTWSLLVLAVWLQAINGFKHLKEEEVLGRVRRQAISLYEDEKTFFDTNQAPMAGRSKKKYSLLKIAEGAPIPPQKVRIRGKGRMNSNEGRVEIFDSMKNKWGPICDDFWSLGDGNVTCRQLGFVNAAREATRGDRYGDGSWKSEDFLLRGIKCSGRENSLLDCPNEPGVCLGKSAGISCVHNTGCEYGWTSYNGVCRRLIKDPLPYKEADKFCNDQGAKLLFILTEAENDFLSNMLYTQFTDVEQMWTGGYYGEVKMDSGKTKSRWSWFSTIHSVEAWRTQSLWFPGFADRREATKRPIGDQRQRSCLALSRLFKRGDDQLHDVGYFWWDNLSCLQSLPFMCQKNKPMGRADCYNNNGFNYRGRVTRTTQGSVCAKWSDPTAPVNDQSNPNTGLGNHNFCRNPDNDQMPWCWVNPSAGVYGYCAIGRCAEVTAAPVRPKPTASPPGFGQGGCNSFEFHCPSMVSYNRQCIEKSQVCDKASHCQGKEDESVEFCKKYLCQDNEFYCSADVFCILKTYVCDGRKQCTDGADEKNCTAVADQEFLKNYDKTDNQIVEDDEKLQYFQVSIVKCIQNCKNMYPRFKCRGFNYLPAYKDRLYSECQLLTKVKGDEGVSLTAVSYPAAHYSQKRTCQNPAAEAMFTCASGMCIEAKLKCDGRNDCGDNSDEMNCTGTQSTPFEIRLIGSTKMYEGKVEVRYQGEWGYVCDEGFDMNNAKVICKQLGFEDAFEAVIMAANRFGKTRNPNIILADVKCTGSELSVDQCPHSPWRQHNCRPDQLAGVVCKVDRACTGEEFRCQKDKSCIPVTKVCDGTSDCSDGADEPTGKCQLAVRLVGGPDSKSGRVEVTKGYSTSTICDDSFSDKEAAVICKMLKIDGVAKAVLDKRFGTGSGMVALSTLHCRGTEESLEKCNGYNWVSHTCGHSEDVGVECGLSPQAIVTTTKASVATAGPRRGCGIRPIVQSRARVVGGFETIKGAFPWQVGVRQKAYDYDFHHCGGTIVSPDWIVSAAHCYTRPKSEFRVRTGDFDNAADDKYEQVFEIEELILHPQWDSSNYDYDLALIKVERVDNIGIQFNNFVQPVCLPNLGDKPDPNTKCFVSGWGDTLSEYPEKLLAAEVPLLSRERCNGMYKGRLTDRMQCAGYEGGGIDTCQGDSGGPLVCKVTGIYTILGATSWGNGCAQPRSPGVYTNIQVLREWVREITSL